ncbi:hypothetical protein GOBAR_AA16189 [Gossypium barbadense]|uniref:AN1-type domain-containing protein n=1 Tax=Gossypium barbadense TaxID=3634 RepID=A0A2P5XM89_GOSBA|nr:hypothetical protein GOBAR_AA16189 [Gossypium barbadense]
MAQRTEKEETEFKVPETLTLCVNNCGVTAATTATATTNSPMTASNRSGYDTAEKKSVNRCSGCRKRVGLTGFRCRCGELFCSDHRYSDRHDCSYDYKAAGREAIARENPVVKAAKIIRV